MSSRHTKPVRECNGCTLNARTHCLLHEHPGDLWTRNKCPDYTTDPRAAEPPMLEGAKLAREERRALQHERQTREHRLGFKPPTR